MSILGRSRTVSADAVRRLGPSVSPGNRIPIRGKRTGSVRIFIPKKLINTLRSRAMPRLSGYRSTPPDLAERMLERLDAGSESTCDAKRGCDRPGFCVVAAQQRSRSQGRISSLPPLNAIVGVAKTDLLIIRLPARSSLFPYTTPFPAAPVYEYRR